MKQKAIDMDAIKNPQVKMVVDSFIMTNGVGGSIEIDETLFRWLDECSTMGNIFSAQEYSDFVNDQIKLHPKELISFLYNQRLESLMRYNCMSSGYAARPLVTSITRIAPINNGTAIMIFLIGLVLLIRMDGYKEKEVKLFYLAIVCYVCSKLFLDMDWST